MSKSLINITLGALLLLLPALLALYSAWHWDAHTPPIAAYPLYLVTQTVSTPWGGLSSLGLGLLLYRYQAPSPRQRARLVILIVLIVGGGQGIKTCLKPYFAEPRPYVVALMGEMHEAPNAFYQQTIPQRQQLIEQVSHFWLLIPRWQLTHWQHETSFSFPSGHSFFAASWLLLFFALVNLRRSWPVLIIVVLWAWAVMWSRMALGMHWPRDVIASIVIAWVLTIVIMIGEYFLSLRRT